MHSQIAYGVRVKLNSNFKEKCLGDKYLKEEPVLFISDNHRVYNDTKGEYVHIRGGSLINSGYAYLDELDLEFEVPENPLYKFGDSGEIINIVDIKLTEIDQLDILIGVPKNI